MKTDYSISVILPVFNGERYLAEAIESVLAQTYSPLELLVVDDGSTDGSAAIAQQYRFVTYFHQVNKGAGAARNLGVSKAQGEFLAFLDADDLWLPEKLAQQVSVLKEQPELDMVFGHVDEFYSSDLPTGLRLRQPGQNVPGLVPITMIIRKTAFERVGEFASSFHIAEFFDWYVRANELEIRSAIFPLVVAKRRLHGTNHGIRKRVRQKEYVQIVKSMLDRRRSTSER